MHCGLGLLNDALGPELGVISKKWRMLHQEVLDEHANRSDGLSSQGSELIQGCL